MVFFNMALTSLEFKQLCALGVLILTAVTVGDPAGRQRDPPLRSE
jgi:hypothetical protein